MEIRTGAEKAPHLAFDELKSADISSLTPNEAVGLLSELERPDDVELYVRSPDAKALLGKVAESDSWQDIDRAVTEAKRLGLFYTDTSKLDPAFDGPMIEPRDIINTQRPKEKIKSFAAAELAQLRERRAELYNHDVDQFTAHEAKYRHQPAPEALTSDQRAEAARRMITEQQSLEAATQARTGEAKMQSRRQGKEVTELEVAEAQAWKEGAARDRETMLFLNNNAELQRYDRLISSTPNLEMRQLIEKEKANYTKALREKAADINLKAAVAAGEIRAAAQNRDETERKIDSSQDFAEERALAMREAVGIKTDAIPDWTEKKGGILHSKANRGPKIIEEGYVSPLSPHIMVVERRLRRTGELVSQTAFATRQPAIERPHLNGDRYVPPRNLGPRMQKERQADKLVLNKKHNVSAMDYVAGWGDYLPGQRGLSYDRKKGQIRRSRNWILSWFGI